MSLLQKDIIREKNTVSQAAAAGGSLQHGKVLPQLLQKLLSVDVLWKRVLRLLGRGVAALKISNLGSDKTPRLEFMEQQS